MLISNNKCSGGKNSQNGNETTTLHTSLETKQRNYRKKTGSPIIEPDGDDDKPANVNVLPNHINAKFSIEDLTWTPALLRKVDHIKADPRQPRQTKFWIDY